MDREVNQVQQKKVREPALIPFDIQQKINVFKDRFNNTQGLSDSQIKDVKDRVCEQVSTQIQIEKRIQEILLTGDSCIGERINICVGPFGLAFRIKRIIR